MSRIAACVVSILVACSSGTTSSPGPIGPGVPPTTPDAAPAPAVLSQHDCEEMVMAIVDLALAEQGSAATPPDRDALRAKLAPFVPECTGQPRELLTCVLAATSLDAATACQPRPAAAGSAETK